MECVLTSNNKKACKAKQFLKMQFNRKPCELASMVGRVPSYFLPNHKMYCTCCSSCLLTDTFALGVLAKLIVKNEVNGIITSFVVIIHDRLYA